jgi:23S rRNA pseudouridine2605 synthase
MDGKEKNGERIAKVMARAGLCSRRDAERWIAEGRVSLNGRRLDSPAVTVGPGDSVTVDGKPLPQAEQTRLFLYHKPAGLVTTARDEKGRPTVFDHLPEGLPRVVSVGRLDLTTEGLLLLTNDGGLARHLELPATGWNRRYRVRAKGTPDPARLKALADGFTAADGTRFGPVEAKVERQQGANCWLDVSLREGKNREVRRAMEEAGLEVNRLIRISYCPFQLSDIPPGSAKEVPQKVMREQAAAFFGAPPAKQNAKQAVKQEGKQGGKPAPKRKAATDKPRAHQDPRNSPRSEAPRREKAARRAKRQTVKGGRR